MWILAFSSMQLPKWYLFKMTLCCYNVLLLRKLQWKNKMFILVSDLTPAAEKELLDVLKQCSMHHSKTMRVTKIPLLWKLTSET